MLNPAKQPMDSQNEGEVLSTIFGPPAQGLPVFFNNAFRRQASAIPEGGYVDLKAAKKGSLGHPGESAASATLEQSRVSEAELQTGSGSKPKKKGRLNEHLSLEPLSSAKELSQQENQSGSGSAKVGKKSTPGRTVEKLDKSFVTDTGFAKQGDGSYASHETSFEKKTSSGKKGKHGKRVFQDASEPHKPMKRQKTSNKDDSIRALAHGSFSSQAAGPVHSNSSPKKANVGTKRKKEDSLEARYEKKLRILDDAVPARNNLQPTSATKEEEAKSEGTNLQITKAQIRNEGTSVQTKKRKRVEDDENAIETPTSRKFDADEKLQRTIFVGNLPLAVKKKAIIKEFSAYGPVGSVRLRSVPLLDTKIPRRGAIITGQINEAVDSQHAYVVFKTRSDAKAALAHNMKEFCGNHIRVDAAYVPHGHAGKGKSSLHYDHQRSLFVGNIPFDVKDEELYTTFGVGKSAELDVEAIRVIRDPQTSISKGIAYVLFKTKAGASFFLSPKRKVKLRDRILRISRVLASQSMEKQKLPGPFKRVRKAEETRKQPEDTDSQRKRAKLSASYQGVRARKEPKKERYKGMRSSGGQQHIGGFSVKGRGKGPANVAGTKRKRAEKKQRGNSRSKKIRRT